ncbi:MAG: DNA translocase FtsK 4TM domain-containing protein [Halanaerobiales bacterium]
MEDKNKETINVDKINEQEKINEQKDKERKNEIIGILLIAWGLISILAVFTGAAGMVGQWLSEFYYYTAGRGGYILPFLIIIWGFSLVRFKGIKFNSRLFGFLLSFIMILALIHTNLFSDFPMEYAGLGRGGGITGGLITWLFINLFGKIGSYIVFSTFLLIGILLWFDIFLKSIFQKIENITSNIWPSSLFNKNDESVTDKNPELRRLEPAEEVAVVEEEDGNNTEEVYDIYETSDEESKEKEDRDQKDKSLKKNNDGEKQVSKDYKLPGLKLLKKSGSQKVKLNNKTELLEETLKSFGVEASVIDVNHGPTITRYEVQPASGVKVSKIVNLSNDIALALAAPDVRIEAPIPGKAAVGIEVPHNGEITVRLSEILADKKFKKSKSKLTLALGKGIDGEPIVADLAKMPHLLIAGATGSGKSVCINGLIASMIYKATPDELKMIMVDPKKVELSHYEGLPHLFTPVVTDPKKASNVLKLVVEEMEKRYELFSESGTRGITSYNKKVNDKEKLPYIVVLIDELSDLMMVAANEVEDNICRLAQMSRAAGIHLIIATQRPSVDVITGLIKANIPSRISFAVSSQTDSRTILDMGGAEKLLGKGDMLFAPVSASKPQRIQGAFIDDSEIARLVDYVKEQADPEYEVESDDIKEIDISSKKDKDELYEEAVKLVVKYRASISMLQRRLHIGHSRAARMIDTMEEEGIVGPYAGSKPREVLIDEDDLAEYLEDEKIENENNEDDEDNKEDSNNNEGQDNDQSKNQEIES